MTGCDQRSVYAGKKFNFVAKSGDFFNGIALIVAKDMREKKQGSWPAM